MARQFYNRRSTVSNSHSYNVMKNKARQAAQARQQGDYDAAQKIFDEIDYIFGDKEIDLTKATKVINSNKFHVKGANRKESTKLTNLLNKLHSDNAFESMPTTGFHKNSAIEKAIDFNGKISFVEQDVSTFASYSDMIKAYDRLKDMQGKAGNYLYLFDTETFGGTNRSKIWNPLGVTEFAMQKIDLATGDFTKTNIVLGMNPTIENKKLVNKILNALGTSLNDPDVKDGDIKIDPSIIMNDEELRVTAYRLALYGDEGSKFKFNKQLGYMEAEELAAEITDFLDPEKIKRGYQMNIDAFNAAGKTKYGLNKAQLAMIDSVAEMYEAAWNGTGMVGGQNIVPFDFKTVNAELRKMRQSLEYAINSGGMNGIPVKEAKLGLDYLNTRFKKYDAIGVLSKTQETYGTMSLPSQQIFDTLPMINFIKEHFGINTLYKNDQEAIMKASNGTAKQENVGAVWFPDLFASGEAHRADFDVDVQRNFFTAPIKELGNKTFIEHFMEHEGGSGLKGLNLREQKIIAGGEQQLFYAKKGIHDRTYAGKAALDHVINKKTGEVFLASNYEIMGKNKTASFTGNKNMGSQLSKGQFYFVDSIQQLDTKNLPSELGDVLPELNGQSIYQVRMRMAVGKDYMGQGLEDIEYVMHFDNEYEMSGWFSSHFGMPAVKGDDGKWKFNNNEALDLFEKIMLEDGQMKTVPGTYGSDPNTLVDDMLNFKSKSTLMDRALRDITGDRQLGKISDQVEIRKILKDAGLENVTKEEIRDILNGKQIARMSGMNYKDAQQLIQDVIKQAGYEPKDAKGTTKLYGSTINKIITSWDFVSKQDPFFSQVLDDLDVFATKLNYTKEQQKAIFSNAVENLKTQVANILYDTPEEVKKAVHNVTNYEGSLKNLKNIYEVSLPDKFILDQRKIHKVQTALNFDAQKNILTVRLDNKNSAAYNLVDSLVSLKFGTRNLDSNPENFQRRALYEFTEHLKTLPEFENSAYLQSAWDHITQDTVNFNINTASDFVIKAMNEVKEIDPSLGIINDINVRTMDIDQQFVDALNLIAQGAIDDNYINNLKLSGADEATIEKFQKLRNISIVNTVRNAPVPFDVKSSRYQGTDTEKIREFIKQNVLNKYMPNQQEFESRLINMTDEEIWHRKTLYKKLEEQVTNRLTDVTEALSRVPGGELYIAEDGQFIFKHGGQAIPIEALPKVKMNGVELYGEVGRSPVELRLKWGVDKTGGIKITTNLEDSFERGKMVTNKIKKAVEDGKFKPDMVANITSHLSKEFREDSRYAFVSGNMFTNLMVDTGDLDTILPRLFNKDGDLNQYLDRINIPDDVKEFIAEQIGNADKEIESGKLDPRLNQYLSAYRIEILQGYTEALAANSPEALRIVRNLTIGTKGKGKQERGILMGAGLRFETGALDSFNDLGRPVVDSSGNVQWIASEALDENIISKNIGGTFYKGALFEDNMSKRVNRQVSDGAGEIMTSWTSRTAYVGEYGLKTILDNNFDKVMNNNTVKHITKEQKENVYNMLYAYVNTFEQQKVYNARAFDEMMKGKKPANIVKLSSAKDFVNITRTAKDADKYDRLLDMMGSIKMSPEGVISYKSGRGEIVKRGDTIVSYAQYGAKDGRANWTSNMDRALLHFQVTNKQGVKLTDEQISEILNKNKDIFKDVDFTNRGETLKALKTALDDYEMNFAVEDINRIMLPKILVGDVEKSMNHILYAKTGSIDENVAKVFKMYGKETEELLYGTVLTDQALDAAFGDTKRRRAVAKAAGFKSWGKFVKAWEKEMFTMSDMIFGKGGLFEGFTDIGSDNLFGHGNKGAQFLGSLNDAILMLGKYSSGGVENNAARIKGLEEFVKMYNNDEKYQFIKNNGFSQGKGVKLQVVDGHLELEGGRAFNKNLENSDYIDYKKLENLIRDVDSFLESKNASVEDRLIHNFKIYKDEEKGIDRYVQYNGETLQEGESTKEFIGRKIFSKNEKGELEMIGGQAAIDHKLVIDSETQSSMPQEYYDRKLDYLHMKGERANIEGELAKAEQAFNDNPTDPDIEQRYLELKSKKDMMDMEIEELDEWLTNMESTGHSYRIGDQEEKILKNYLLSDHSIDAINHQINEGGLDKNIFSTNEAFRGVDFEKYKNKSAYADLIEELHAQKYYNPYIDNKVLKEKDLKTEKYKHLEGMYDRFVRAGITDKLGAESAQLMYDIESAALADKFNNLGEASIEDLLEGDRYKIMTPDQYINQFGDPSVPGYDSVIKQNVLLELDLKDGRGKQYIAVPGMGTVMEQNEIKQTWHEYAGRLSTMYQQKFLPLHGEPLESQKVRDSMTNIMNDLRTSTKEYMEKGSSLHKWMRQEVHAGTDRVKILSMMPSEKNPLFTQARVDGKSLYDWYKQGVYYDYSFDSLESFEKRGYFKEDFLQKMNMTREQMIEHLKTEGTVMLDDRYPNIRERSVTPVRHYLAMGPNNESFLANNAAMLAPWTEKALKGDSDGDSISRVLVKRKGIDYVQYGVARKRAVDEIDQMNIMDNFEREELIKQKTIDNINEMIQKDTNKHRLFLRKFKEKDYEVFKAKDINMAVSATTENKTTWFEEVLDQMKGDDAKAKRAMIIKEGDSYLQAEYDKGRSILGMIKVNALSETPTWAQIGSNVDDINQALETLQNNSQYLSKDTREYVESILSDSTNIWEHKNEIDSLDKLLVGMEELQRHKKAPVNQDGFEKIQNAVLERIRINRYHEEGMQKLGVTATGNVNATLYGVSQAVKSRYGDVTSPLYDELKRFVTSDISYWAEETPISGKKFKIKAGDKRLFEFSKVFKDIERSYNNGGPTTEHLEAMQNYFKTYMDHDWIAKTYDKAHDRLGTPSAARLIDKADKVDDIIKQYTNVVAEALNPKSSMYAEVLAHRSLGRRNAHPGAVWHLSGKMWLTSNAAEAAYLVHGKALDHTTISDDILDNASSVRMKRVMQKFEMPDDNSKTKMIAELGNRVSNKISKAIIDSGNNFGKSLGLGVVGLAAGLIAAGYATGNPLNDADPETIVEQKGYEGVKAAPEMMFSSGQGFAPNNTGGYIINIKGDTRKGNRQLKRALKQATKNIGGSSNVVMNIKTSTSQGPYTDQDIENILNNYF